MKLSDKIKIFQRLHVKIGETFSSSKFVDHFFRNRIPPHVIGGEEMYESGEALGNDELNATQPEIVPFVVGRC